MHDCHPLLRPDLYPQLEPAAGAELERSNVFGLAAAQVLIQSRVQRLFQPCLFLWRPRSRPQVRHPPMLVRRQAASARSAGARHHEVADLSLQTGPHAPRSHHAWCVILVDLSERKCVLAPAKDACSHKAHGLARLRTRHPHGTRVQRAVLAVPDLAHIPVLLRQALLRVCVCMAVQPVVVRQRPPRRACLTHNHVFSQPRTAFRKLNFQREERRGGVEEEPALARAAGQEEAHTRAKQQRVRKRGELTQPRRYTLCILPMRFPLPGAGVPPPPPPRHVRLQTPRRYGDASPFQPEARESPAPANAPLVALQQEAEQERRLASQCVKSLTTEVVRLAGQLRAHRGPASGSRSKSRDKLRPGASPLPPARRRRSSLSERADAHAEREAPREQRRDDSVTWAGRDQSWDCADSHVEKQRRVEQAMLDLAKYRVESAFEVWRFGMSPRAKDSACGVATRVRVYQPTDSAHGTDANALALSAQADIDSSRRAGLETDRESCNWSQLYGRPALRVAPVAHDGTFTNDQDWYTPYKEGVRDQAQGSSETKVSVSFAQASPPQGHWRTQTITRTSREEEFSHVALMQMHARWWRRRLAARFFTFAAQCRDERVRKRSFVTLSMQYMCNLMRRSLRVLQRQRLRGLKRQRALETEYLHVLRAVRVIVVAWRGCISQKHLFTDNEQAIGSSKKELAWSVTNLNRTLNDLDADRNVLAQRVQLLEEEMIEGANPTRREHLPITDNAQGTRLICSPSLATTSPQNFPYRPDMETIGSAQRERGQGQSEFYEDLYQTLESTVRTQAQDLQQLEKDLRYSSAAAAATQLAARAEITDMLQMIREGKDDAVSQKELLTAAVETREARVRDTWVAFDELERALQDSRSHTCAESASTPAAPCGIAPDRDDAREAGARVRDMISKHHGTRHYFRWQKMADLFDEMADPAMLQEYPGITLQLIREHFEELRAAAIAIRTKDTQSTEKSLRRLQVNAKLLHVESTKKQSASGALHGSLEVTPLATSSPDSEAPQPGQDFEAARSSLKVLQLQLDEAVSPANSKPSEYWI